jgi:hypothetical protein
MMKSYCQFILAVILLAQGGCSWRKSRPDDSSILSRVEAVWFAQDKNIRLANWHGEPQPHLFFDPLPELNPSMSHINFLPLHVAGTEKFYDLDVLSGQRHFSHFMCSQPDAWKKDGNISGITSYTTGIVPRHFDQLNRPQRVIVFGGESVFRIDEPVTYRARIVGAVVEQICPSGKCSGPKEWTGRMVLVGVYDREEKWKNVKTIQQLGEIVDWEKVRNQLENLNGRNQVADKQYPAVKVGRLIDPQSAMEFMLKRSVVLTGQELVGMKRSCTKIYQQLWEEVGKETILDLPVKTTEQAKAHAKELEALKKLKKPTYFNQRLGSFIRKYHNELHTCSRLVYPGNPNENQKKTKFIHWISMFMSLHKNGWAYNCRGRSWGMTNYGKEAVDDLLSYLPSCTVREIDFAMKYLPPFLRSLRGTTGERWRYVGWDEHAHGSHSKIEAWVSVPDRAFACKNDPNKKIRESWSEIPEGVLWDERYNPNDFKDSEYIF